MVERAYYNLAEEWFSEITGISDVPSSNIFMRDKRDDQQKVRDEWYNNVEKIVKQNPPAFKKFCDALRYDKIFYDDGDVSDDITRLKHTTLGDMWTQKTGLKMTRDDINRMLRGRGVDLDNLYDDDTP